MSSTKAEEDAGAAQLREFMQELTAAQRRLRAFIFALMPGSPDVGDVLQETNLMLWNNRDRYQSGANFMAWAFTLARFEVLNHRKRMKKLGRIQFSEEVQIALAQQAPDGSDDEAYLLILEACLAKLPDKQRELVKCRYDSEGSLEDYARKAGRKPSAIRVALLRIRAALRECIETTLKNQPA